MNTVSTLLERAQAGERGPLARLLSLVERGGDDAREVGAIAHRAAGNGYTVGITGAPGAGKSTLTAALITRVRSQDVELAVLAIDPTSPFSGGAILGDRVRMQDHTLDAGVFIRSMATRGHLGGLALATPQAIRVLDAAGFPWVLLETVGVGQVEVEVAGAADTTVVVVNPGWGDAVQANKAGLMEIADVFVINKADRPGAQETKNDLQQMLALGASGGHHADAAGWIPPVLETVATDGSGTSELWAAVAEHRAHLEATGELERARAGRLEKEIDQIVGLLIKDRVRATALSGKMDALRGAAARRETDPWSAAATLVNDVCPPAPG